MRAPIKYKDTAYGCQTPGGRLLAVLRGRGGMSLLELLISMAILALLALGFSGLFLPAISLEGRAARLNRGSAAAATALEQLMNGENAADVAAALPGVTLSEPGGTGFGVTFPAQGGSPEVAVGQTSGRVASAKDDETGARLEAYIPESP